ncbi:SNF2, N-terminal [Dillenia turbinata]|uniref:Chromatin-remodeling ATPase INO80 n=1 Tax=Dillenia turbinata TaxID=194707 RepID=A0AAN8W4Y4_9MAGN
MDSKPHSHSGFSFAALFNLESLMNFQLPQQDDDFDYYGNSSQDESRSSQGGVMANLSNGVMSEREFGSLRKKRRPNVEADASEDEEHGGRGIQMTEERYRTMLGEHVQRYKRRFKDNSSSPASSRMAVPTPKNNLGSKSRKSGHELRGGLHEVETATADYVTSISPQKLGNYHETDFASDYVADRTNYDSSYLDIGEGNSYRIPPPYEKLAPQLNLPTFSDIRVEDYYLKGTLDLGSLAAMMAADRRFGSRSRAGMGEPQPQYESLQAKLKALSASNSVQKFSLKISDAGLNSSSIPEGAAGGIQRSILSEGGQLQIYYVKVLEKGDTYEIIERSLPKKQPVKKDASMIEKEEMEKVGKVWVNIAKRDIPKYHRIFNNFHRKQLTDAKKCSEFCQREVKNKVSRSLRLMRGSSIRTRKLARDMLVFWKRVDKEMRRNAASGREVANSELDCNGIKYLFLQAELRKKEEKEAAEALKREQELREAKRQQQRLNFLLSQTELYSHFMQNKSTSQPSEALSVGGEIPAATEVPMSPSDDIPEEEEDPEEAKLKWEALRAAQDAVSKQKMITSAFDDECSKFRQAADAEAIHDPSIAGSNNIDLLHPSTMPVTSSVQTPEMFKGSLKGYQLKGLQWLVNCYEQGLNGILADEMGLGKTIQAMAFLAHLAEEKNIWGPFLVVAPASVLNNWADEISRFCPDLKTLPYWGGLQERMVLRKNINPKRLYRRDAGFHILITSYQLLVSDEKYFRRVKWQYMVLDEAQAIKSSNSIENHAEHGGTLNEHQLNRLHAILKPFMLRRVKKDVISELTGKTEVTVHCKLSSRQQAFYQAIKNKISLAELFDGSRGHLNEKKILNLMNIVIQLRKVCNHPELFERNEGSTYFYFAEIPNSLQPAPFGELEDVHYSGGQNPITYQIPKLIYEEIIRYGGMLCTGEGHGLTREFFVKHFNVFNPDNVYRSAVPLVNNASDFVIRSEGFGFTRLMDLSPAEVGFLATGSFMERLLFSIVRWGRQFLDDIINLLLEVDENDPQYSDIDSGKVRSVTRLLLTPSKSEATMLQRRVPTGPGNALFEALVVSHQDRLISDIKLLHSAYTFIPRSRAPPINGHCPDRNFTYKMLEELHHPWVKRLLVGFARTSDSSGPRKPEKQHCLIQEIDSEVIVSQPALQLTHKIFGSSPPMQSFDPAKMLTDSGKLQTLDILLKRLRAENHRVLLFAQMTKMLNILEDYMNYRKYRYLRLDGSSTIMDRRDMVTVYRLICKETVEEKILQRASQKSTVQQLVMTGGHVQGDLLAPEDVVSLLLDDAQLEQKLRELPVQGRDSQKKKRGTKGIRLDAEGDASLEDLTNIATKTNGVEPSPEEEKAKPNNKKRKPPGDKQTPPKARNSQRALKNADSYVGMNEPNSAEVDFDVDDPLQNNNALQSQRPKRPKRPKKSINENLEPAFAATPMMSLEQIQYPPSPEFGSVDTRTEATEGISQHSDFLI